MDDSEEVLEIDDHKLDLIDLYQRYNTDPKTGLTDAKAEEVLKRDGPNILSPPKKTPNWIKFCRQISGGFGCLFLIGAILCFIVHGLTGSESQEDILISYLRLGIILIMIVIVNELFPYYQESEISQIMDSMKYMIAQGTLVIRDGKKKNMNIKDLVVGDIVEINSGDCIPADIRILESSGFKVDDSSLTGEPEPKLCSAEFTDDYAHETKNLAFFGAFAVEGTAKGLVIRTGDCTEIGRIADLRRHRVANLSTSDIPIIREIFHSTGFITRLALFLGISFFVIAIRLDYTLLESVILLVVIIIASVPRGIILTATTCLTFIAEEMRRKNCLIKNLKDIETLGSTSIICVGKTGILTENRKAVTFMWFDNRIVEADYTDDQRLDYYDNKSDTFLALTRCAMLCNRADFIQDPENLREPVTDRLCNGDACEGALLKFVEVSIGNVNEFRETNRKVCEIPFNSTNKFQLSIHEVHTNNESEDNSQSYLLVMKGAPERMIERCSTIYINGIDVEMNDHWRNLINRACFDLGSSGEQILGFCDLRLPDNEYPYPYQFDVNEVNFPMTNLRFLGLMSMIAPLKENIRATIEECRSAGIKVIMITGDHPVTARAIAGALNIISEQSETVEDIAQRLGISLELVNSSDARARLIHGNDLEGISLTEIDALLRDDKEIVFTRVSPEQKVIIVERCQRQGAIVTMIGNAANDSAALKKADFGVAMGIAGSDVNKEAANIILLDDNLASIVTSVEQGRLMFDNLKKAIAYTLTSNIAKVLLVLICLLTPISLTWGITTMLCIDLVNIIGAISLAYEKPETNIMKRQPRKPQYNRLVNKRLILMAYGLMGITQVAAGFFAYFLFITEEEHVNDFQNFYGEELTDEQLKQLELTCYSAIFVTIVICQCATLIIYRARRDFLVQQGMNNLILNFRTVFEIILIAIISYLIYSNSNFNINSLKLRWWLPSLSYIVLILIYDEIRKYIIHKHPGSWLARNTYY